jgi:hypothetical protein
MMRLYEPTAAEAEIIAQIEAAPDTVTAQDLFDDLARTAKYVSMTCRQRQGGRFRAVVNLHLVPDPAPPAEPVGMVRRADGTLLPAEAYRA